MIHQWRSQAGTRAPATGGRAPPPTAGALALIIDAEGAVVDRDWVHKGLESSSADSYLYPQKSHAVRSGECTRLSYYNEVSYAQGPCEFAVSNEVTFTPRTNPA